MHAEMWIDRLLADREGRRRLRAAITKLWPYAIALLDRPLRHGLAARALERLGIAGSFESPHARGETSPEWRALWGEMTSVRRLAPSARW
jgi:hypothetical protein